MVNMPDDRIVAAVLADDGEASGGFWIDISERLRVFAEKKGLMAADAADVVQESLQHALSEIRKGKYRGEGTLAGWIYGIYRHKLADFLDRAGRSRRQLTPLEIASADGELQDMRLACRGPNPEEVAGVRNALAQLPPRERAAIILSELVGLSAREFAPYLGVSPRAASGLLTRARQRLAEIGSSAGKAPRPKRLRE